MDGLSVNFWRAVATDPDGVAASRAEGGGEQ